MSLPGTRHKRTQKFTKSFLGIGLICLLSCAAGGSDQDDARRVPGDGSDLGLDNDGTESGSSGLQGIDLGGGVGLDPGVDGEFTGVPTCEECQDFPAAPIFGDGLTSEVEAAFASAPSGTGPCILEPRDGMLIPANMLRPRIHFSGGGDLHQIVISAEREANDLVAYTTQDTWWLPTEVWDGLRSNVFEEDITVTVRSVQGGSAPAESQVRFQVAPVQAGGSMIYWGATTEQPGLETTRLFGFGVGEEAVIAALRPEDVQETMLGDNGRIKRQEYGAPEGQARCVGCHTSTGDGRAVITGDHWPWNLAVTDITEGGGGRPEYVTDMGALLMQMPWLGVSTTSREDWATGRRYLVTSAGPRAAMEESFTPSQNQPERDMGFGQSQNQTHRDELIWIDMAANGEVPPLSGDQYEKPLSQAMLDQRGVGWGVLARDGDGRAAVTPDWNHRGNLIAYTSTDNTSDGRIGQNANEVDIYTVPFADGEGGVASPVPGASEPGVAEYYPDFSADDRFIAFNRVQEGRGRIYYHPQGEIYVVPTQGGTPLRLAANDPPECSGESSPGVTNSWPKWSPAVRGGPAGTEHEGKRYYFLLFSSARRSPFRLGQGPASQLYLATLVELPSGELRSYPAMYLWNQSYEIVAGDAETAEIRPIQTSNLTPAFDEFVIPPRPPVILR